MFYRFVMVRSTLMVILVLLSAALRGQPDNTTDFSASREKAFRINGYLKTLPSLDLNNLTDDISFNNTLYNRLNLRYTHNNHLQVVLEVRNRLISGNMVTDYHDLLMESLRTDNGLINASFVPVSEKNYVWHLHPDRFYADWQHNRWQIRMGRQRINWGVNMVSNPNDLFNNYSFFDFDYEERPGADALRIQHYTGDMARLELALSPARETDQSVAALMYAFNHRSVDLQFIAGYYRNRTVIGTGWATHIRESGFKGEISLFNSIAQPDSMTLVAALSFDHLFPSSLYGFVEMLYNGGYHSNESDFFQMTNPMSADNIFISQYAITASLNYPVSPILNASAAAMYMPDIDGFYIMPSILWSALTNVDLSLLAQFFQLKQSDTTLRLFRPYLQLKWSF